MQTGPAECHKGPRNAVIRMARGQHAQPAQWGRFSAGGWRLRARRRTSNVMRGEMMKGLEGQEGKGEAGQALRLPAAWGAGRRLVRADLRRARAPGGTPPSSCPGARDSPLCDPLLKHEGVAAVAVAHAQPALARLRVLAAAGSGEHGESGVGWGEGGWGPRGGRAARPRAARVSQAAAPARILTWAAASGCHTSPRTLGRSRRPAVRGGGGGGGAPADQPGTPGPRPHRCGLPAPSLLSPDRLPPPAGLPRPRPLPALPLPQLTPSAASTAVCVTSVVGFDLRMWAASIRPVTRHTRGGGGVVRPHVTPAQRLSR